MNKQDGKMEKEINLRFDNPEEFFDKLPQYWLGNYKVEASANPITKVYTIKAIPIKGGKR